MQSLQTVRKSMLSVKANYGIEFENLITLLAAFASAPWERSNVTISKWLTPSCRGVFPPWTTTWSNTYPKFYTFLRTTVRFWILAPRLTSSSTPALCPTLAEMWIAAFPLPYWIEQMTKVESLKISQTVCPYWSILAVLFNQCSISCKSLSAAALHNSSVSTRPCRAPISSSQVGLPEKSLEENKVQNEEWLGESRIHSNLLFNAAKSNNLRLVEHWLNNNADVNARAMVCLSKN